MLDYLRLCRINIKVGDVNDAVAVIEEVMGRELKVQEPPRDNGASRRLATLNADSSGVSALISNEEPSVIPQNIIEFWAVATRPLANNGLGLTR